MIAIAFTLAHVAGLAVAVTGMVRDDYGLITAGVILLAVVAYFRPIRAAR